ncbi:hypothetical protein TYRP_019715 [Tyrophagus putrescentiae]|nr:hypothetical protein TYRP_019715 [Tyrophagus putrescentiae]
MTTTTDEDEGEGSRGRRRTSRRPILAEVVECPERAWGEELPSLATVEMHDMLAAVINATHCTDDSVGSERPAENRVFAAAAAAKTKLKQPKKKNPPSTTSPFYEALKTILASTEEEDNAAPLETDDSGRLLGAVPVILILTHAGFTACSGECLEVLTDLLATYLAQFTSLMRTFSDDQDLVDTTGGGSTDFVDTVSKVMAHMGVPDLDTLRRFNDELAEYERKLKRRSPEERAIFKAEETEKTEKKKKEKRRDKEKEKKKASDPGTSTAVKVKVEEEEAMEVEVASSSEPPPTQQ